KRCSSNISIPVNGSVIFPTIYIVSFAFFHVTGLPPALPFASGQTLLRRVFSSHCGSSVCTRNFSCRAFARSPGSPAGSTRNHPEFFGFKPSGFLQFGQRRRPPVYGARDDNGLPGRSFVFGNGYQLPG